MKIVPKPPCFGTIEKFAYFCTKYKHTLMKELDSITQDRQDALQLMINAQLFAPSTSALAKRLGYKGKTSLYRIQQGEASAGAIEEAWDKLLAFVGGTEQQLFAAARAVGYFRTFKHLVQDESKSEVEKKHPHQWVLLSIMKKDEHHFSERFQQEVWPELMDLRNNDTDAFWMMMALYYFDAEGADAYARDFDLLGVLNRLHSLLMKNYENCDRPKRSVSNIFREEYVNSFAKQCTWDLVQCGYVALLCYGDPEALSKTAQGYALFALGDDSYWIAPGVVYGQGAHVWHLIEIRLDEGIHGMYYAIELEVGRNKEEFSVVQIVPALFSNSSDALQLELPPNRKPFIAKYEWNNDYTELRIIASKEQMGQYGLPMQLQRIDLHNPQGKDEKIWALVMKGYDVRKPDEIMQAIFQFEGVGYLDEYNTENVTIDRHTLTITVNKRDEGTTDYTIGVGRYGFLKTLLPSDIVEVVYMYATDQLAFRWIDKPYVIPLEEFEKG